MSQFAMIPNDAADLELDGTAWRVYVAMAAKAGTDRRVWIRQQALADRFGMSRQGVAKVIRRLERAGVVVPDGRKKTPGTNRWQNRY